jgi:hypothetical protein
MKTWMLCMIAVGAWAQGLEPFTMDHRHATAPAIDLSGAGPAGKSGFVHVAGGHLVDGAGKRIRFWGVNVTDWSRGSVMIPSKEDAAMYASTLARFGVNCVRLHFLDLPTPRGLIDSTKDDTRSFDKDQLDRLDFWIAELIKHGVYVDLNLNVGRSYKPADGVKDPDRIRWGKGLTYFDARLIELQKEYATALLSHRNPYTKTEYRAEPGVSIVEIANENALYVGFRAPTPAYQEELNGIYAEWRKKRDLPAATLLQGRDVAAATREQYETELAFYNETEASFYAEMKHHLRDTLGVKQPIVATADHSHTGSSYAMLRQTSQLDIVDGHDYWQHPGSPKHNTPMVNEPLASTVVELSRTAFAGKPYTVSEINEPFPNDYAAEQIPILASYAALQDWDGIFWYTFEPKKDPDWKPYVGDPFDISLDPVRMTQLAAGALLFARGDVTAAKETFARSYSRDQVNASGRLGRTEAPYFTPGFPLSLPLMHGSRIGSLDGAPTATFPAAGDAPYVSDTKELVWKPGVVTVDAAKSQAAIGFLKDNPVSLRHLAAHLETEFAAVILCAVDDRPIERSVRMLLTAGSTVANTNNGPPSTIRNVRGDLVLRNLAGARRVTISALDGSGARMGTPAAAEKTPEGWRVKLGETVTSWYEVRVER